MIWAILALLGVPIWLVVGGLAAMLLSRSRFKKREGVFPAKMRQGSGAGANWPRMSNYALWVHDVLLVHKGLGLLQTVPLGVAGVEGPAEIAPPQEVKGLGEHPVLLRFRLDDGDVLQMAVPGNSQKLAQGPFG